MFIKIKICPTYVTSEVNNLDTNSNYSNQSNNEGDHNTNQREGIDPKKEQKQK